MSTPSSTGTTLAPCALNTTLLPMLASFTFTTILTLRITRRFKSNPQKYFSIFMSDPAEYYYGPGLLVFLNRFVETGHWKRPNNKIAVVTGSQNYSVVIADAIKRRPRTMGGKSASLRLWSYQSRSGDQR